MRETFLDLIESEPIISDRFTKVTRLDPQGGNGYFSLMFTAFDTTTDREVVLKFFDPEHSRNIDRLSRFQREGEILLQLRGQPNILACIDGVCNIEISVTAAGSIKVPFPFQYIPLEKATASIEQVINSPGKTPIKCLLYFKAMCKGVARIHNQGLCHRDLKPSNFLLFGKDVIKVGDFGTAKFLDGRMPDIQPRYSVPVGELNYCSPELFCRLGIGDVRSYSSDIFALGAILFEMFSEQILTQYVYTQDVLNDLMRLGTHLFDLPTKEQTHYYSELIGSIISPRSFPNIFEFNDFVPRGIKGHLNELYRRLTEPDFTKRLDDFNAIHRKIDICVLILRNELRYQQYMKRKKEIREKQGETNA